MFAPLPRTQNIHRTYTSHAQTTSKKNVDKENNHGLPSKTPSRAGPMKMGAPGTSVRLGLGVGPVTGLKDRNVPDGGEERGKGKGKEGEDIGPKRLFQSTSQTQIQPSKSFSSLSLIPNKQKTPHVPRTQLSLRTPAPPPVVQPSPAPLPSASRVRRRSKQSLTPLKQVAGDKSYSTPAPSGKWDEGESLDSINEGLNELQLGSGPSVGGALHELAEVEEEGSDNEVEYMPPPVTELPWEPAWSHPDIGKVFATLSTLPPLWRPYDDSDLTETELPSIDLTMIPEPGLKLMDEEELEEPMFRRKVSKQPIKAVSAKPVSDAMKGTSRTATSAPLKTIKSTTNLSSKPFSRPPAAGVLLKSVKPQPVPSKSGHPTLVKKLVPSAPRPTAVRAAPAPVSKVIPIAPEKVAPEVNFGGMVLQDSLELDGAEDIMFDLGLDE